MRPCWVVLQVFAFHSPLFTRLPLSVYISIPFVDTSVFICSCEFAFVYLQLVWLFFQFGGIQPHFEPSIFAISHITATVIHICSLFSTSFQSSTNLYYSWIIFAIYINLNWGVKPQRFCKVALSNNMQDCFRGCLKKNSHIYNLHSIFLTRFSVTSTTSCMHFHWKCFNLTGICSPPKGVPASFVFSMWAS